MKSLKRIGTRPASLPLAADDVVEFHAARILLLVSLCGTANRIDGLTKMAKMDFFARYPEFFDIARGHAKGQSATDTTMVESAMVRHHYGPWDKRYYHVLAHLEAKGLITVSKDKKTYLIKLTDVGRERAKQLAAKPSFAALVARMKEIKEAFGKRSGSFLKDMIYEVFDREVGKRRMGEVIER